LRAPLSGTIQASSVTTVGQVLKSGEEIMRIVPGRCRARNRMLPAELGHRLRQRGQEAVVEIESFPFTRYGTINARVTRVARDAIPSPRPSRPNRTARNRRGAHSPARRSARRIWCFRRH
jgi:hemolysin D